MNGIDIINVSGDEMRNDEKVPSVISYSPASENQELQWGSSLSSNAVAMVHTKLALDVRGNSEELDLILESLDGMHDLKFQHIKDFKGSPPYPWKIPEVIVEDYLTKAFDAFLEAMDSRLDNGFKQEIRDHLPVDIVVTIPAVCLRMPLNV